MLKRDKLTDAERTSLTQFIGDCVMQNVIFPPVQVGGQGITIQELCHNRSQTSLISYADHLDKQSSNVTRLQRRTGITEKRIGTTSVTYKTTVDMIDLIVKEKDYLEYKRDSSNKKEELKAKLESLKTPEELRKAIEEQLAEIED